MADTDIREKAQAVVREGKAAWGGGSLSEAIDNLADALAEPPPDHADAICTEIERRIEELGGCTYGSSRRDELRVLLKWVRAHG